MSKTANISWVVLLLAFVWQGCSKEDVLNREPSVEEIEKYTRDKQDDNAVFTYAQYRELLAELSKSKYKVLPINEFRNYKDGSKVLVGFRHDIDWHPFKAVEMARLENEYGLRSTWYVLPTAPYFGRFELNEIRRFKSMGPVYQELARRGEVGIHLDLLTVMVFWQLNPMVEHNKDMSLFRDLNINIYGAASHGSKIAQITHVNNYEMIKEYTHRQFFRYRDKTYPLGQFTLHQAGFEYEAYHINYEWYFSDVGGKWNTPGGDFEGMMEQLRKAPPGMRIELLVHPVWWKK